MISQPRITDPSRGGVIGFDQHILRESGDQFEIEASRRCLGPRPG